jgi:uracil-DNA glycosylase family 4
MDDPLDIAQDLARRIRWEVENGVLGYERKKSPASVPAIPVEQTIDKKAALATLRQELGDCKRCGLHKGRTKIVFGAGNPEARLVFVGEGPGQQEDESGIPFVGRAGELLNKIINAIGLKRDDVYICNIVKCRPPDNRDPQPQETGICGPFMMRQLEIISPEVVVCLGRPSAQYVLDTSRPIGKLRGHFHNMGGMRVMPTFHPAYLLRNESAKRPVWEDMKLVRAALGLQKGGP